MAIVLVDCEKYLMDGLLKVLSEEEREGSLDLARMDMAGSTLTFESQRGGVQSELV